MQRKTFDNNKFKKLGELESDYFGKRYNPDKPIIVSSEFMVARIK